MSYDHPKLIADLIRDEALRLKLYQDSIGKWTIGIGRNLSDRGISDAEARWLCTNDVALAEHDLDAHCPWWRTLSDARQRALLNMCFNLGWPKLAGFPLMLGHLQRGEWVAAAQEALASHWASQVGARAQRIAAMFETGLSP